MKQNGTRRKTKTDDLRGRALEVLVRELGYADAVRFMMLHERGKGDYTRDLAKLMPDKAVAELAREADGLVRKAGRVQKRRRTAS